MRPRVFPAEDGTKLTTCPSRSSSFNEAAGIPRGRLLASFILPSGLCGFNEAAGIPRGRRMRRHRLASAIRSFNEAAGIPRGRPPDLLEVHQRDQASMRPRVFPAEDARLRR